MQRQGSRHYLGTEGFFHRRFVSKDCTKVLLLMVKSNFGRLTRMAGSFDALIKPTILSVLRASRLFNTVFSPTTSKDRPTLSGGRIKRH